MCSIKVMDYLYREKDKHIGKALTKVVKMIFVEDINPQRIPLLLLEEIQRLIRDE